jgi:uncharacterized damage-inducible protein DinB
MSTTLTPLIANYLDGGQLVRAAVRGMSPEQMLARPVADKWSTLEVLCHLADFEPIYADRMKRVIAEDRPQLLAADEKHFATALAYQERDGEEELVLIEHTRSQMARILRTLSEGALQRRGVHSESGPITLEQLLDYAIRHIRHHVSFIHEKRRALGLPG